MNDLFTSTVFNKSLPIKAIDVYCCVLQDKSLSLKAKGLHCYLRTFPDGWKFHASHLAKELRVSRHTIEKLFLELIEKELVERAPARGENGCFMGYTYLVYPVKLDLYVKLSRETSTDVQKLENGDRCTKTPETVN